MAAVFAGYPLGWVLGLSAVLPILMAVPMAAQLARRDRLRLPSGIGWWLLFLVWLLLGALVLWADAPGAVAGGGGGRLLVFGYRVAWYAAATVVLLWVLNTDERSLPERTVVLLAGLMFVIATAGGLLGLAAPHLEFRSAVEYLLPAGLRGNAFVAGLVHPEAADVQTVLGRPETRPKAPFAFTNTWGSVMALSLVFYLAALVRAPRRWLAPGLLLVAVALVPIVYSLNRGLWASLALGVAATLVLLAVRGRGRLVAALLLAGVLMLVALAASPLGDLYRDRLENQHSNDRRGQLIETTVGSMTSGSPVVGFGNTRDVQGSFSSIAGGSTPDCPACGVPPLGTQGHLWLLLFAQGWFGAAFFLTFVVLALARAARCRTDAEVVCAVVLAMLLLQIAVYDTLGMPLYLAMVAIGLAARGSPVDRAPRSLTDSRRLGRELRRTLPVTATLAVAGGALAWGGTMLSSEPGYLARTELVITPAPVYLDVGPEAAALGGQPLEPRPATLDTEAALLVSQATLERAGARTGSDPAALRPAITLSAVPLSNVLVVVVRDRDPGRAEQLTRAVGESYLTSRRDYLDRSRDAMLQRLRSEQLALDRFDESTASGRRYLASAINHLTVTRPSAGEVVRREPARAAPDRRRVALTSGLGLGLLVGVTHGALSTRWRPTRRRRSHD